MSVLPLLLLHSTGLRCLQLCVARIRGMRRKQRALFDDRGSRHSHLDHTRDPWHVVGKGHPRTIVLRSEENDRRLMRREASDTSVL